MTDMSASDEAKSERERMDAEVDRLCGARRLPGHRAPLSDPAAIAVAAGRVDDATRAVLITRHRAGRSLPSIGGFGALRSLVDDRDRWLAKDTVNKPGSSVVYRLRAAELTKKIGRLRAAVVMSNRHYAVGVRAARRERREGLHLDLSERDAVFDALTRTPAPRTFGIVAQRGLSLLDAAKDRVTELSRNTSVAERVDKATGLVDQLMDQKDDRFDDRYETLLFLAGTTFDRIERSPAWRSPHFAIQRNQLDLFSELAEISVDVEALREVAADLTRIGETMIDEETWAQVESRRAALDVVWTQLTGRVSALIRVADLVESSEEDARTSDAIARAHSVDDRIDDLVGRSGNREMSADNTHFAVDMRSTQWRD